MRDVFDHAAVVFGSFLCLALVPLVRAFLVAAFETEITEVSDSKEASDVGNDVVVVSVKEQPVLFLFSVVALVHECFPEIDATGTKHGLNQIHNIDVAIQSFFNQRNIHQTNLFVPGQWGLFAELLCNF